MEDLTFTVRPGLVTGFLGPNGAGKTTTLRMILGLDLPTSGSATIDGRPHHELPSPLRVIGSMLEAQAVHPQRTTYKHLLYLAQSNSIPAGRVAEVLDLVGLADVAGRKAGCSPGSTRPTAPRSTSPRWTCVPSPPTPGTTSPRSTRPGPSPSPARTEGRRRALP
ncbi:ATP-binding cassette domain-containing protein [Nonomuraea deserti]|uniref:ATP-binding cassette domain-containing protein n=1 Tax=Nonomuraea deserti TaxID=1848322 RepID=UPI002482773D|nr:ATP-binding cassette domain-containing protein [Nonomuraea deserti]